MGLLTTPIAPGASTASGSPWPPVGSAKPPDYYTGRLEHEIIPEPIIEAAIEMARADLKRSRNLMKTAMLR